MRGLPNLCFVLVAFSFSLIPIYVACTLFPGDLGQLLGYAGWWLTMFLLVFIQAEFDARALDKRMLLLMSALDGCGDMQSQKREEHFRDRLLRNLYPLLSIPPRPEYSLPSGTRVAGWFHHDRDDWYISIKKGLENQQRLKLQGEIEDIIQQTAGGDSDVWIFGVVGCNANNPLEMKRLHELRKFAAARQKLGRDASKSLFIRIVQVQLTDASVEGD